MCLETVPQFTVFFITRKLYQSTLCNISILGFVHSAVRLLFGPLWMYAQKRLCGGITTLLAWHNNNDHSLIRLLYLAIIASNDYSEYVYHTMPPIIDFNSCSALGPIW